MSYHPQTSPIDLPRGARTRVRLPDAMAQSRLFPGWGPSVP